MVELCEGRRNSWMTRQTRRVNQHWGLGSFDLSFGEHLRGQQKNKAGQAYTRPAP